MCYHGEQAHHGLKGEELKASLREAERRCEAHQEQLTAPRRRVLQLLLRADGPLKAYDLIATYDGGKPTHPPTVYRALEFLARMGFVHRIESLNAFVACRLDGLEHRAAFLICDCCGAAEEFEPDFSAEIAAAQQAGYSLQSVTLEAHGRCAACQA
jgi:Fur family zinc uptake transcriptional regulator